MSLLRFRFEGNAFPFLRRLERRLKDRSQRSRFLLQVGAKVRREAQGRALAKGGRRFWRDVARSINLVGANADSVDVAAEHVAAAQKQFGGTIEAKGKARGGADFLTIPITEEARGRRASEFGDDLFVLGTPGGSQGVLGYDSGDGFRALFVLKRRVEQEADPFMPTTAEATRMAEDEAERWLARIA